MIDSRDWRQARSLTVALTLALAMSACDDPSNVGLGLVDDQLNEPLTEQVEPASTTLAVSDVTGGADRLLAGAVEDPVLGRLEATGFVDFGSGSGADADFRAATIDKLLLRFTPDYVYGDTLSDATLGLYASTSAIASTAGFRADTTLALGAPVQTIAFAPKADRVEIELTADYLASVQAAVRSENFVDDYVGLFLGVPPSGAGNAVVGLRLNDLELRAVQGTDTVAFPALRTGIASLIRRTTDAAIPADRLLLQDGTGPGIALRPDLSALSDAVVHGARLTLPVDTSLATQTPTGFARPNLDRLALYAVDSDGTEVLLQQGIRSEDTILFGDAALRTYLQSVALGTRSFDRFEVRFDTFFASLNSINATLLKQGVDDSATLRIALTQTRAGE